MQSKKVAGSELQVRVINRRLVKASVGRDECKPGADVLSVSNLDLIPNTYQASVLCIYPKPATGDFAAFEAGLPSLLDHFFPLAGRIVRNPHSGLPEVHCRNQGAELVVGEAAGVALRNLDFGLAEASLKRILVPYDEDLALSVQLVSFACGGFSVAWSNNNLVLDGSSATRLVRAWSELARSGSGTVVVGPAPAVSFDRSALRPRDPPSYSAALDEMFTPFDGAHLVNVLTARESFVERLYYVEARDIERLREMASNDEQRASRVQAVSAYLWKSLAAAVLAASPSKRDARCRMGWYVDARRRVTSPELRAALADYVGNAAPYVDAEASAETVLRKRSLADVAAMVREAIVSVDYDERVQEMVDWVEEHKAAQDDVVETATVGLGSPTLSQGVWASFALDTDFGFGDAALAMPIWASEGLCSGNVVVTAHPAGDGSWLVSADLWPRLHAALQADDMRIFKPLTAA